jgi:hypothetical protein
VRYWLEINVKWVMRRSFLSLVCKSRLNASEDFVLVDEEEFLGRNCNATC